jgi:signal transduction histidine kinase
VICRTTGMGFAAVARVTEGRWIACGVQDGIAFGLQPGGELKVETTICHEVRQHGAPVVINNVAEDKTYRDHITPAMYGFQSYISMPIILPDGSFFGTLCAIDPKPHMLDTPAIIGSCKLFAELIAFHLDANIRVAASQEALAREQESSKLREQFIAVLGHDLRNPLSSVSVATELLLRNPQNGAKLAPLIQGSVNRMAGLISDLMDLARGRLGGGMAVTRDADVMIEPTLAHVIAELQTSHPDREIQFDRALDQPVACDPRRMAQLFSNLLGNALTHGAASAPVRVRATSAAGLFTLSVANAGAAIPREHHDHLFKPFFRTADNGKREGLGLGLYISAEIARAHGGTIKVASTPSETRFTFQMPTSV